MLRTDDAAAIRAESARADTTAPAVIRQVIVRADGLNTPTMLLGTTTDGLDIRNIRPGAGRLFTFDDDRERRRVVLLGPTTARNLFGQVDPVGRTVRIGFAPFDVIGVTQPQGIDPAGVDQDNRVVVPLSTAMRRLLNVPYVDAVFVRARTGGDLVPLEREVRDILHRRLGTRSGTSDPFVVLNQAVLLRTERATARAMNQVIAAVAVLAVVVGGVGIAAVMLISVRERTPEIGLRRALGAKRRDIRRQFVIESAVLATVGGVGGVIVGTGAAAAAALLGPWELVHSWNVVVLGLACSSVLGLVVGVIPAARAAYLEPATALRAR
jgi:putative ABC transport system permease protein